MRYIFTILFLLNFSCIAQAQSVTGVEQGRPCSIRGLSVVDDHVAWVSGSNGHIAVSTDGGQTWKWQIVKGFEQSDFRDIEAFSENNAIIMSSGTPALILKTTNGGTNWNVVYRADDKAYFLDGMDFTTDGEHGFVMGDPIDGKFLLLETQNAGNTWHQIADAPKAMPGEAAFAASGTCISIQNNRFINIVTGGIKSRVLSAQFGDKMNRHWVAGTLPIVQGKDSQGTFSMVSSKSGHAVFVGGDYQNPNRTDSAACYTSKPNKTIFTTNKPVHPPAGYQSCVAFLEKSTFLSTGTPGTHITTNGGKSWRQIDSISFNVCQKAKHGKLVILAGDKGKIAIFQNQ